MADAVVLDSSAIMAVLRGESGSEAVTQLLESGHSETLISSVNLCEIVTKLTLEGVPDFHIAVMMEPFMRYCVPFDCSHAVAAGRLVRQTRSLGLSLGDRVCLGLAMVSGAIAWTTDLAWKKLDNLEVKVRLLRGE